MELKEATSKLMRAWVCLFLAAGSVQAADSLVHLDFNGPSYPQNGESPPALYPNQYTGEGGQAAVSLDAGAAKFHRTAGRIYAQFNPYTNSARGFARDYSKEKSNWKFNTYNRLTFWVKHGPGHEPVNTDGSANIQFGTYVKRVQNADTHSDEAGGFHYYHLIDIPNTDTWTKVIINSHPTHGRSEAGDSDQNNQPHPTGEAAYNYFDCLTRFYYDGGYSRIPTVPTDYWFDQFVFYREVNVENDEQVYSIAASYVPQSNRIILTWNRNKDETALNHEVRYAFTDIHSIGWNAAVPAPGGIISPLGEGGYNQMAYQNDTLPLTGKPRVYLAIKPQGAALFSQIDMPLDNSPSDPIEGSTPAPSRPQRLRASAY
jgi:hypothetical protein